MHRARAPHAGSAAGTKEGALAQLVAECPAGLAMPAPHLLPALGVNASQAAPPVLLLLLLRYRETGKAVCCWACETGCPALGAVHEVHVRCLTAAPAAAAPAAVHAPAGLVHVSPHMMAVRPLWRQQAVRSAPQPLLPSCRARGRGSATAPVRWQGVNMPKTIRVLISPGKGFAAHSQYQVQLERG